MCCGCVSIIATPSYSRCGLHRCHNRAGFVKGTTGEVARHCTVQAVTLTVYFFGSCSEGANTMTIVNLSQPEDNNSGSTIEVQFINATGHGYARRLQCSTGTTLRELNESQGVTDPSRYQILVNGEPAAAEYVLQDGDKVVASVSNIKGA